MCVCVFLKEPGILLHVAVPLASAVFYDSDYVAHDMLYIDKYRASKD